MKRCEYIRALARRQEGFGLIEFLTAMVILAIAVSALLTVFTAAGLSLRRAGDRGTATTLAERQLELYRKLAWEEIRIDDSQLSVAADVPAPYLTQTDQWFPSNPGTQQVADGIVSTGSDATNSCLSPVPFPDPCDPVQNVTGPDHHPYRIDTYIKYEESADGTPITSIKRVWVVVYHRVNGDGSLWSRLARASSSYARFNYAVQ